MLSKSQPGFRMLNAEKSTCFVLHSAQRTHAACIEQGLSSTRVELVRGAAIDNAEEDLHSDKHTPRVSRSERTRCARRQSVSLATEALTRQFGWYTGNPGMDTVFCSSLLRLYIWNSKANLSSRCTTCLKAASVINE
jgi:hypothetical protein